MNYISIKLCKKKGGTQMFNISVQVDNHGKKNTADKNDHFLPKIAIFIMPIAIGKLNQSFRRPFKKQCFNILTIIIFEAELYQDVFFFLILWWSLSENTYPPIYQVWNNIHKHLLEVVISKRCVCFLDLCQNVLY